jgi:hypothetical protein
MQTTVALAVWVNNGGERPAPGVDLGELPSALEGEAQRLFERLWREAWDMVEANWPAIERVAEALLHRRVLIEEDIDALIWPAGERQRFRLPQMTTAPTRTLRGCP